MEIIQKIKTNGLIFDGALGTMLIKAGVGNQKISDYWNLEKPGLIKDIHRSYIKAGADIVTTNTFGASRLKLKKVKLDMHLEEINQNAVRVAKNVNGKNNYVAGDIGPIGEMLSPNGPISFEEAQDNFSEQAEVLSKSGIDIYIVETMYDINEALAAIQGIRLVSNLPIISTLTFDYKNKSFATVMGNQAIDSFKQLINIGANIIGANCSLGSNTMVLLSQLINEQFKGLTIIQPNAGLPDVVGHNLVYPETIEEFTENIITIKKNGINIVGGCCGTTPEYIAAINNALNANTNN